MKARSLFPAILQDLKSKKMVFLAGPRQVGKTTLAQQILTQAKNSAYLNWDNRSHRKQILNVQWPEAPACIVLDELHKYRTWKGFIKGEYDVHKDHYQFIITGSARMDLYRRSSDSLQGRYHHLRLHPFSLNELSKQLPKLKPSEKLKFKDKDLDKAQENLERLFDYSGFPEPLLKASPQNHRRWQKERLDRFFREDVRDLENIRDLASLELLADLLPEKIGSPISLNSLREDLEVSHRAVSHWMDVLDRLYYSFRIQPFSSSKIRSLKKEAKVYLWDWTLIDDPALRFENLMASHLLKLCHFLEDTEGYPMGLYYLRDVDKREVDFVVTLKRKVWFVVEAKFKSDQISSHLKYFQKRLDIPFSFQVTYQNFRDYVQNGIHLLPAAKFLSALV